MSIYVLDADATIHAWDWYYKPRVFPTLWRKLEQIKAHSIVMPKVIFAQVKGDGTLSEWISSNLKAEPLDAAANRLAVELREKYETNNSGDGADEADIDLIAYAKQHSPNHSVAVVTHEAEQEELPKEKSRYKIPAICELESLKYIRFPEMIEELGIVI